MVSFKPKNSVKEGLSYSEICRKPGIYRFIKPAIDNCTVRIVVLKTKNENLILHINDGKEISDLRNNRVYENEKFAFEPVDEIMVIGE